MKGLASLLFASCVLAATQPNILFILTDDQDSYMNSIDYMPLVQKYVVSEGIFFKQHYCTVAVCCPSRANLWTGKAAHNTNVTDVKPPYGGYPKFVSEGWNDNYLPIWLQNAGYNTYYAGKLWNGHNVNNYNKPLVNGFNGSEFLLDPYTYRYNDSMMTRNGEVPVSYAGQYSTDVLTNKTLGFLDEALSNDAPWMVTAAPTAPHSNLIRDNDTGLQYFRAPLWAERHDGLFSDYKVPRDASFNKLTNGAAGWHKTLKKMNQTVIDYNDGYQIARLRALQAVDDMVEALIQKVEAAGQLDNTYIFYTTDNGFHISQHRMSPGKECGYETDIHIPLVIRGPDVPKNVSVSGVTSHTDIATTILNIAGAPKQLDGKALPLTKKATQNFTAEVAIIEFWGRAVPEGVYRVWHDDPVTGESIKGFDNNTWKAVRLIGEDYSLYYSFWCSNETEFYDLVADPTQMENYAFDNSTAANYELYGRPLDQVISRLNGLMMVTKSCKELQCTQPWGALHTDGSVTSLKDALDDKYDEFYANQPQVAFSSCSLGYIKSQEGPQKWNVYKESLREQKELDYGALWRQYA